MISTINARRRRSSTDNGGGGDDDGTGIMAEHAARTDGTRRSTETRFTVGTRDRTARLRHLLLRSSFSPVIVTPRPGRRLRVIIIIIIITRWIYGGGEKKGN